jgi:hypothetical protein
MDIHLDIDGMLIREAIEWAGDLALARARLRVEVKKLLREYGYPPDAEKVATELILEQTERFVESGEV